MQDEISSVPTETALFCTHSVLSELQEIHISWLQVLWCKSVSVWGADDRDRDSWLPSSDSNCVWHIRPQLEPGTRFMILCAKGWLFQVTAGPTYDRGNTGHYLANEKRNKSKAPWRWLRLILWSPQCRSEEFPTGSLVRKTFAYTEYD